MRYKSAVKKQGVSPLGWPPPDGNNQSAGIRRAAVCKGRTETFSGSGEHALNANMDGYLQVACRASQCLRACHGIVLEERLLTRLPEHRSLNRRHPPRHHGVARFAGRR